MKKETEIKTSGTITEIKDRLEAESKGYIIINYALFNESKKKEILLGILILLTYFVLGLLLGKAL